MLCCSDWDPRILVVDIKGQKPSGTLLCVVYYSSCSNYEDTPFCCSTLTAEKTSLSRNEDWWKTVPKRKGTSVAPVLFLHKGTQQ